MKIIITSKEAVKTLAACLVASSKKDVRYYLNGVHFRPEHMEATDGHRCITVKYNKDFEVTGAESGAFICPNFKLLARSVRVEILREGATITVSQWDKRGDETTALLKVIDGRFPDTGRVMADPYKTTPTERVSFNPAYLADVTKALGHYNCILNLNGEHGNTAVSWQDLPNVSYTIMPVRLPK